jgi:hypothetical protein
VTPALFAGIAAGLGSGLLGLLFWDWLGERWPLARGPYLLAIPLAWFSIFCGTATHILVEIP